jgi:hypothetical protein
MDAGVWALVIAAALAAPAPPAACAARGSAFLQSLAGEWEVEAEFRSGEGGFEGATGRASIAPELGGCVLVERYAGTRGGKPWDFLVILGANGPGPAIQEVFVHSQHGIMALSSGEVTGGALVLEDAPVVDGKVILIRHVYFDVNADGFRYESRRSTDKGASWTVSWRARYKRSTGAKGR